VILVWRLRLRLAAVSASGRAGRLGRRAVWAGSTGPGVSFTGCRGRPTGAVAARRRPTPPPSSPNQAYSWDITKLPGPATWTYYRLYVILDSYARHAVGWMVATCESAVLAETLIAAACAKQGIIRGQLSIHADRCSLTTASRSRCCWRTWASPSPIPARTSVMTTRTSRRSSRG
jgi:transposase InsO family protein